MTAGKLKVPERQNAVLSPQTQALIKDVIGCLDSMQFYLQNTGDLLQIHKEKPCLRRGGIKIPAGLCRYGSQSSLWKQSLIQFIIQASSKSLFCLLSFGRVVLSEVRVWMESVGPPHPPEVHQGSLGLNPQDSERGGQELNCLKQLWGSLNSSQSPWCLSVHCLLHANYLLCLLSLPQDIGFHLKSFI